MKTMQPADVCFEAERAGIKAIPRLASDAARFYLFPKAIHLDPFKRMLAWEAIPKGLWLQKTNE